MRTMYIRFHFDYQLATFFIKCSLELIYWLYFRSTLFLQFWKSSKFLFKTSYALIVLKNVLWSYLKLSRISSSRRTLINTDIELRVCIELVFLKYNIFCYWWSILKVIIYIFLTCDPFMIVDCTVSKLINIILILFYALAKET